MKWMILGTLISATFAMSPAMAQSSDEAQLEESLRRLQEIGGLAQTSATTEFSAPPVRSTPAPAQTSAQAEAETDLARTLNQTDIIGEEAFAKSVTNLLPMTPSQIRTLHSLLSETQRAAADTPGVPPRPVVTSQTVDLAPGASPPVIRLANGNVSSLVFLDSTGQPWPVSFYNLGNPQAFNIQWDQESNILLVQALTPYKTANLAIGLKNLNTPIMVKFVPDQPVVDYRVDLRIPGLGPNGKPVYDGLPGTESPVLLDVLNGVPPQGSKPLKIGGGDAQAWLFGNTLYLRTKLTLLSPGFISTLSSADGTHAYALNRVPMLLASQHGKTVKLNVKGLD